MTVETKYRLSKSTYMRGQQCLKSLYLYKHHFDLQDEVTPAQQAIFDMGHTVGELARQLFPGGVDLTPERGERFKPMFAEAIQRTREELGKGTQVLYEPVLVHRGVMAAMDILVRDGDRYRAYEVKSGTSVKPTYADDAALQHWVLTGAGLDLADVSIVHIDTSYVRRGEIDVHGLFAIESVLDHALEQSGEIGHTVERLYQVIDGPSVPEVPVGPHCSDPYDCSFMGHCRAGRVPEPPARGEPHVARDQVREFVDGLSHPLYFLDFETVGPAIPLYDGTSPYRPVPFQYSLHRRDAPGGELEHFAFLGDGRTDPRPALAEQLLDDAGAEGDILMYTAYERTQLNHLVEHVPARAAELQAVADRLVDLSTPFRTRAYSTPQMAGKYSIKTVLPALVPDLSYEGMDIAEGKGASSAYESLHHEADLERIATVRQALLDYCHLDTLAMVRILEVLERV